jgi:hypothetical protein
MSNRVNCDGVGFDREQHAPVAGTQPHSGHALERLYVASAGFGNLRSICARVAAVSLRHWRAAAEVNAISLTEE